MQRRFRGARHAASRRYGVDRAQSCAQHTSQCRWIYDHQANIDDLPTVSAVAVAIRILVDHSPDSQGVLRPADSAKGDYAY